MKIIGLKVEGIRKLKAFRMKFEDKGLTQIRGQNKQGKSTVIDCIELLLRGNKMETKDMITHGKDSAEVVGQVDKWLIKRVLKKEGSNSLEVRDLSTKLKLDTKPQDFLNSLINELTFNPLPWLSKTSDEKLRFIQDLTGLDLTTIDAEIKTAESDRYDAGVVLRNLGSKPDPVEKMEQINVDELLKTLHTERDKQQDVEDELGRLDNHKRTKLLLDEKILSLESALKLANTERDQELKDISDSNKTIKNLPVPEVEKAEKAFDNVEKINEKASNYAMWVTDLENWTKSKELHVAGELKVRAARIKKDEMLKKAKMPIKGMEIRDDGLYFDGTHCENWSDSEGYEIALNVCLAMKPKLEAIFIDRGELFDAKGQKALQEWAEKHNIQIGIAIVDDDVKASSDGVFFIVDGEVQ